MIQVNLIKDKKDKGQYEKVINTSFTQLVSPTTSSIDNNISIQQFFQYYNELFFTIPKFGSINSHEYLVKTSADYIDFQTTNNELEALIDEITYLREQNLELNQQILNITGSV